MKNVQTVKCLNYRCKEQFQATFQESQRFIKHTIKCNPLYLCENCGGEHITYVSCLTHQKICDGMKKRETKVSAFLQILLYPSLTNTINASETYTVLQNINFGSKTILLEFLY